MSQVRLRFAPSPTGYLHMGGARTALFNWLYARRHGGVFILRVEDTDRERSTQASIDAILDAMGWLGLDWDEGPFFQTERMERYDAALQQLVDSGRAYRCVCTPEELSAEREAAMAEGRKPMYNRRCRDAALGADCGKPFVWRFRAPLEGETVVEDLVRGRVVFNNEELDDLVLVRSDGSPTYNFCVVVDDSDMQVSHVIRGEDHLSNTPRQILMYQALGRTVPQFGHLPLIKGLSKRKGSQSVQTYRDQGLPSTGVVNYLARLGWSHGDQELFDRDELVRYFGLDAVGKAGGQFDADKLAWVCAQHMHRATPAALAAQVRPLLQVEGVAAPDDGYLEAAILQLRERSAHLKDLAHGLIPYFRHLEPEPKAAKHLRKLGAEGLRAIAAGLGALPQWTEDAVGTALREIAAAREVKLGRIAQPLRAALTGRVASAGIFEVAGLLGREVVLQRLEASAAAL